MLAIFVAIVLKVTFEKNHEKFKINSNNNSNKNVLDLLLEFGFLLDF